MTTRGRPQRTYRLLTTSDGDSLLVGGDAAATLKAGARYAIHGTSSGSFVDAKSATRIADVAKAASAGIAAQYDGILRLGHMDFTDRPSEYFYAVFMANGHHKQLRDLQMLDVLKNGMEVSLLGSLAADATSPSSTSSSAVNHKRLWPARSSSSRRRRIRSSWRPLSFRRRCLHNRPIQAIHSRSIRSTQASSASRP